MPRYTLCPCNAEVRLATHDMSTECATGLTPVPLRGTVKSDTPLPDSDSAPERPPAVVGVNTIVAVTLCPAPSVSGVVNPVLKAVPVTASWVMVAEAVPVLEIFTVCVAVVFSAELPNARLAGVAVSFALPGVCGGVGEGVGAGVGDGEEGVPVDATREPLPPQPININMPSVNANRNRENCCAVVCCFKRVAPAFCSDESLQRGPETLWCLY